MDFGFVTFYSLTILVHAFALYYGLSSWKIGEKYFIGSCVTNLFKSRIEQKFITICIGTLANILFLVVMPLYMVQYNKVGAMHLEPFFVVFHVLSGFATALWHYITYNDIKKGRLDGWE